jgi:hypothetical protein
MMTLNYKSFTLVIAPSLHTKSHEGGGEQDTSLQIFILSWFY